MADKAVFDLSLPQAVWRADAHRPLAYPRVSTGLDELDTALHGGWPTQTIVELFITQRGCGEFSLVAPTLAKQSHAGFVFFLTDAPVIQVATLDGAGLYLPNVRQLPLAQQKDRLWSAEQILKQRVGAALWGWFPAIHTSAVRRLYLAAQEYPGPVFIVRPTTALSDPSFAAVRLYCQALDYQSYKVTILKQMGAPGDTVLTINTADYVS